GADGLYDPPVSVSFEIAGGAKHGSSVKVLPYARAVCSSRFPHPIFYLIDSSGHSRLVLRISLFVSHRAAPEGRAFPTLPCRFVRERRRGQTREHRKGAPLRRAAPLYPE